MRTPQNPSSTVNNDRPRMFIIPCSCNTTFVVSHDYDRQGGRWSSYLACPNCGKRHDPRNRVLEIGFHTQGFWAVDKC